MKKLLYIFFFFLVLLSVIYFSRNILLEAVVERTVHSLVGLKLNIGKLTLSVRDTSIRIEDARLYNPSYFQDAVMIDIPEIVIDYSRDGYMDGQIFFDEISLYVKEFMVVRNEKNELNIKTLKSVRKPKKKEASTETKPKKKRFFIRRLHLKLDTVVYKDYTAVGSPEVNQYSVNLDEQYEDIQSFKALIQLIVVKVLTKTAIGTFTNIDIEGLRSGLGKSVFSVKDKAGKIATTTIDTTADKARKALDLTTDAIKGTTESIKGIFERSPSNE